MSEIAEQYSTGEHETHRAVQFSGMMQVFDRIKNLESDLAEVGKALTEHMRQETKDRESLLQELGGIRMDIKHLESKLELSGANTDARLEEARFDMRRDMNNEWEANVRSVKLELQKDIAQVAHQLDKLSDNIRQDSKDINEKFVRIFKRLDDAEKTLVKNSEWIDLGKRVAYAIVGALTIGVLVAIGIQLK